MENCLVMKLKAAVESNNLPIFEELTITLKNAYSGSDQYALYFRVETASNGITLKASEGFVGGQTELIVGANYFRDVTLNNVAGNVLRITKVYDLKSLTLNSGFADAEITGLNSAGEYGDLVKLNTEGPTIDIANFKNMKAAQGKVNVSDFAEFCANNQDIKLLRINLNASQISSLNSLQQVSEVFGDIADLPTALRYIYLTGNASGTIESWVTKMRNAGRTSGAIRIDYAKNASNVTIVDNGVSIPVSTYCSNHGITSSQTYLSWDASTISIVGTAPANYVEPERFNSI